ncbi:MAG: hypothetical protein KGI60_00175 [Patescibacteria group bacterium]|nr:hypothetical protein [Patescibacteria group bacterium]
MGQVNALKDFKRGQLDAALMKIGQEAGLGTAEGIKALLRGELVVRTLARSFKHDKTLVGWSLLIPGPKVEEDFRPGIVEFLDGENSICDEELRKRARNLGANLGQAHAEYLLERQNRIPWEYRGDDLVFPATVWNPSGGDRYTSDCYSPILVWNGSFWDLGFNRLGNGWNHHARLVKAMQPFRRKAK